MENPNVNQPKPIFFQQKQNKKNSQQQYRLLFSWLLLTLNLPQYHHLVHLWQYSQYEDHLNVTTCLSHYAKCAEPTTTKQATTILEIRDKKYKNITNSAR